MSSATNENKLSTAEASRFESRQLPASSAPRRSIGFRFIVNFGPQLSTPCSRCLEMSPPPSPSVVHPTAPLFHRHLRCHTFTL